MYVFPSCTLESCWWIRRSNICMKCTIKDTDAGILENKTINEHIFLEFLALLKAFRISGGKQQINN